MRAKEIMRKNVVTVDPGMTLKELSRLLIEERISGAPVVDRKGRLLGVVSQTDLVRCDRERRPAAAAPAYYQGDAGVPKRGYQIEDPDFTKVVDVMTPAVLSADENAPVEDVAQVMLRKHIHRVMITRAGRLLGIVTSMDMLKALVALARKAALK